MSGSASPVITSLGHVRTVRRCDASHRAMARSAAQTETGSAFRHSVNEFGLEIGTARGPSGREESVGEFVCDDADSTDLDVGGESFVVRRDTRIGPRNGAHQYHAQYPRVVNECGFECEHATQGVTDDDVRSGMACRGGDVRFRRATAQAPVGRLRSPYRGATRDPVRRARDANCEVGLRRRERAADSSLRTPVLRIHRIRASSPATTMSSPCSKRTSAGTVKSWSSPSRACSDDTEPITKTINSMRAASRRLGGTPASSTSWCSIESTCRAAPSAGYACSTSAIPSIRSSDRRALRAKVRKRCCQEPDCGKSMAARVAWAIRSKSSRLSFT